MTNQIQNLVSIITEAEKKQKLERIKLDYAKNDLEPVMSAETIDYHYGKLYKTYCDRYNAGEGDPDFNEAGAFLHSLYFSQFREPAGANAPTGPARTFIEKHFKTWDAFKEQFEEEAMKIQGSGWIYLAKNGTIKTIKNHQIKNDIVILIDWWEHAWALDYQADKKGYLKGQWRIMDWNYIGGARIF